MRGYTYIALYLGATCLKTRLYVVTLGRVFSFSIQLNLEFQVFLKKVKLYFVCLIDFQVFVERWNDILCA